MLNRSKLKELISLRVAPAIESPLVQAGFKYSKSKQEFTKLENGFTQTIRLFSGGYGSELQFDEQTDTLHLDFSLSAQLTHSKFDQWLDSKMGPRDYAYPALATYRSSLQIPFEDFSKDDFNRPSAAQAFRMRVTASLAKANGGNGYVSSEELVSKVLPELIAKLSHRSDIMRAFESRVHPYEGVEYLIFGGFTDLANKQLDEHYAHLIETINAKIANGDGTVEDDKRWLERFLNSASKLAGRTYDNPFARKIKPVGSKSERLEFGSSISFHETLRLDLDKFRAEHVVVSQHGDILIYSDSKWIFTLDTGGNIVFSLELQKKENFDHIFWPVPVLYLRETNEFLINNYIIRNNDRSYLELPLPVVPLARGKMQDPHVTSACYSQQSDQYVLFYRGDLLFYSRTGQLERTVPIGHASSYDVLVPEKRLLITETGEREKSIFNFDGDKLGSYEFAQGNCMAAISPDASKLVLFFYATKSQYFDLTTGKKETLWAHPTYIAGYKEMYHDIENNFGMDIVGFSPDGKYLIGGAYHGKYVAWTLPGLQRVELIPPEELFRQFVHSRHLKDGEVTVSAELVTLKGEVFLRNRRNHMTHIFFLDDGDIFATAIGQSFVVSWDRNFKPLTYHKINGRLKSHGKYLTIQSEQELVVFERNV